MIKKTDCLTEQDFISVLLYTSYADQKTELSEMTRAHGTTICLRR